MTVCMCVGGCVSVCERVSVFAKGKDATTSRKRSHEATMCLTG